MSTAPVGNEQNLDPSVTKKVLLITTDAAKRTGFRSLLPALGYREVFEAASAPEALAVMRTELVDLVFAPWEAIGLSGAPLMKALRDPGRNQNVPVVLLDDGLAPATVVAAVKAGIAGKVSLPGNLPELRKVLTEIEALEQRKPALSPGKLDTERMETGMEMGMETGMEKLREIVLARPRGFCAGVDRAIAIVETALERFGAPIYVKHAIVHNRHVVERLQRMGAEFVEELADVPRGARVIFSAHGVSPLVREEAVGRGLAVIDATCPLVTKVHTEARRFAGQDRTIFLIGHAEHVEVVGTQGEAPAHIKVVGSLEEAEQVQAANPEKVAFLTQTTLSVDDTRAILEVLKKRFPALTGPGKEDICYATQNRQNAVRALVELVDTVLVVGSKNSSNSNRLVEVAQARGTPAYLVESFAELDPAWLAGIQRVGVTAGASAPESVVADLVNQLSQRSRAEVREIEVIAEDVSFPLPVQLAG